MAGYFLDTNVFIQAQNGPYSIDIVPAFWDWLDREVEVGNISSSTMVYQELTAGNDDLAAWSKDRKDSNLFQSPSVDAQLAFTSISAYVVRNYEPAEANAFLSGADPWVIAQAKAGNMNVVTMEKLVGVNSKKVKIPNVCAQFEVQWLDTYQLLRELGARFRL